jgi:histidyl-tRNA synthetase
LALVAYLEAHQDSLDEDGKRRLYTNPLRVLDSKTPSMQAVCEAAPKLLDFLGDDSRRHYDDWRTMLTAVGVRFTENPRLVRGLDYYNLSVFEWITSDLGAQGTVCGGGRYDGLIEQMGGKPTPAIGFAMGIERLMLLLQEKALLPAAPAPDVFIVNQGEGAACYALTLAQALRQAGVSVVQHCGEASFKSQFKKADASGARLAVVIGDTEVQGRLAVLKPLRGEGEQRTLAASDLPAAVAALLTAA